MKNEFIIDWKHWLFGVNWGTVPLTDPKQKMMGFHFGPFCLAVYL